MGQFVFIPRTSNADNIYNPMQSGNRGIDKLSQKTNKRYP